MTSVNRVRLAAMVLVAVAGGSLPRAVIGQPAPAAAPSATRPTTAPIDVPALVQSELDQLNTVLNSPEASQEARDQAAARLASRPSPLTRRILRDVLSNRNIGGQLAVARALDEQLVPDPDFIQPLFASLQGANRVELAEADAKALASYKGNQEVINQLIGLVRRPQRFLYRIQIIAALGLIEDRRSAETLMSVVSEPSEPPLVREAAYTALIRMTGLEENGQSPELWANWWAAVPKGDAEFRSSIATRRSLRYDRNERVVSELNGYVTTILTQRYFAAAPAQRQDVLLEILNYPLAEVRAVGANIAREDTSYGKSMPPQVLTQLRKMIGDSDVDVRRSVAQALALINDAEALRPLLAQLAQEKDAQVRAALVTALAPITNLEAVPSLLERLNDPSSVVQLAAIKTLGGGLGTKISENPELARRTAMALRDVFDKRPPTEANEEIRIALISAMTPLHVDELLNTFYPILNIQRNESTEMRRRAINAIGALGKAESAGVIATSLSDRAATIRLDAVKALGNLRSASDYVLRLASLVKTDDDRSVRDAAWAVFRTLLNDLTLEQLQDFADSFRADAKKQIEILKRIRDVQVAKGRDEVDNLLATRQTLAAALASVGEHNEAAAEYFAALNSATGLGKNTVVINSLRENYMDELLLSKQYDLAVAFWLTSVREAPSIQRTLSVKLKSRGLALMDEKNYADARALINEVRKMDLSQLSDSYLQELLNVEKQIDRIQGKTTSGPGASAGAPAGGRLSANSNDTTASGR